MTFENLQTNNGNQKEILSMKKTFVKLQEEKVKLMQEDLLFEKQQEECDKQILALKEKQKNLELEDDKQMRVRACQACTTSLINQWTTYQRDQVAVEDRSYVYESPLG